jgi:hypothetical protein
MSESATIVWMDQFGAGGAWDVALDSTGVYVVGQTSASLPYDAFVRKYTPDGNVVWIREFTPQIVRDDYPRRPASAKGVAMDSTGVYVVGGAGYNVPPSTAIESAFVRKYDTSGNEVWTRQFDNQSGALGVAADFTGVYVAGGVTNLRAGTETEGLRHDAFVRKYDSTGTEIWTRQFGSSADAVAHAIAVYSPGVPVVRKNVGVAAFAGLLSSTLLWIAIDRVTANSTRAAVAWETLGIVAVVGLVTAALLWITLYLVAKNSAGVYVVGKTTGALSGQNSAADSDSFVRKYDAQGNEKWTHQFGTPGPDEAVSVAADSTGVYVAAHTLPPGGNAAFVRKYAPGGRVLWTREFAIAADNFAGPVAVDQAGVYAAVHTVGPPGGLGVYVRQYDSSGNEIRTDVLDSSVVYVHGLAFNAGLYVVGEGGQASGAFNFIARLAP